MRRTLAMDTEPAKTRKSQWEWVLVKAIRLVFFPMERTFRTTLAMPMNPVLTLLELLENQAAMDTKLATNVYCLSMMEVVAMGTRSAPSAHATRQALVRVLLVSLLLMNHADFRLALPRKFPL